MRSLSICLMLCGMSLTATAEEPPERVVDKARALLSSEAQSTLPPIQLHVLPVRSDRTVNAWVDHADRSLHLNTNSAAFKNHVHVGGLLMHEVAHLLYGFGEARAYDAELAFLRAHGADPSWVALVERSKAIITKEGR